MGRKIVGVERSCQLSFLGSPAKGALLTPPPPPPCLQEKVHPPLGCLSEHWRRRPPAWGTERASLRPHGDILTDPTALSTSLCVPGAPATPPTCALPTFHTWTAVPHIPALVGGGGGQGVRRGWGHLLGVTVGQGQTPTLSRTEFWDGVDENKNPRAVQTTLLKTLQHRVPRCVRHQFKAQRTPQQH